jgi:membrane protein required for colicin V production
MTLFDYAVFAILCLSLAVGVWRGVVSEVLALAAWVVAFFAAQASAAQVGAATAQWLAEPALQYVAGFAAVFIGVLALFALGRWLVKKLLGAVGLGPLDRMLGGVFGLARAALIVMAFVVVGGLTSMPQQPWWREAQLAPPLETAAIALKPWMPPFVARRIRYR